MTPTTPPIRFIRRGRPVTLVNVPPDRTLLQVLREDLQATGTKEGCGEGDCGACTVVLGEAVDGRVRYRVVNSCIRLAHAIDGLALWTVEDLTADPLLRRPPGSPPGALHPAQQALVDAHGSQCGFCTPGFAMSLFGLYQNRVVSCPGRGLSREQAAADLSGNLCRCTGYRPILDAAQAMGDLPPVQVDEAALLALLAALQDPARAGGDGPMPARGYQAPRSLPALLAARAAQPDAQLVAGCTDVGLWVTKQHRRFDAVLDVTRVPELRQLSRETGALRIGAAVTLEDAFGALVADRPALATFARRFAGLPVRHAGTLGGNVANGSPIGDSMPLLIALGTQVELASVRGTRRLALEDLYTGYRRTAMAPDEVLTALVVPDPAPDEVLRVWKVAKRFDDDISAVCLAVWLRVGDGQVRAARIGAGGVAATPARARRTEATLAGQPWQAPTVRAAMATLRAEFEPLSDLRASAAYRRDLLGNLLWRSWLDTQGSGPLDLSALHDLEALA